MVRLWDSRTGRILQEWQGHATSVFSVAFSPDGKKLLTASWDSTLKLWALDSFGPAGLGVHGEPASEFEQARIVLGRLDSHLGNFGRAQAKPERVALGAALFFDPRLSITGEKSCASCHQPALAFSDGLPRAVGVRGQVGPRRTPSLFNVLYNKSLFWDGRVFRIQDAALSALGNPKEMDRDPRSLVPLLEGFPEYRSGFREVFGSPVSVSAIVDALASFVETIPRPEETAFDKFRIHGAPLSPEALRGFLLFGGKARCIRCHNGKNFTDGSFHQTGVKGGAPPDPGRFLVDPKPENFGAFRTPSLRNVANSAPYMHDGSLATLKDVIAFYKRGGDSRPVDQSIAPLELTSAEEAALVEFLKTLTLDPAPFQIPLRSGPVGERAPGRLRGIVRWPAGAAALATSAPAVVTLKDLAVGVTMRAPVAANGLYEFGSVPEGWYVLRIDGEGPEYAQYSPRAVQVERGKDSTADIALVLGASLLVGPRASGPWDASGRSTDPQPFIFGLPAGAPLPQAAALLLSEEEGAPISLRPNVRGEWRSAFALGYPQRNLFSPGRYDFHRVEVRDAPGILAVRVLETRPGVTLVSGSTVPLEFSATSASGGCVLSGKFMPLRPPPLRDRGPWETSGAIFQHFVPQIQVFDDSRVYLGTAFAALSEDDLTTLLTALDLKDAGRLQELYAKRSWEFRMEGLNPGNYRVRAVAAGYRDRLIDLKLDAGGMPLLSVAMDPISSEIPYGGRPR